MPVELNLDSSSSFPFPSTHGTSRPTLSSMAVDVDGSSPTLYGPQPPEPISSEHTAPLSTVSIAHPATSHSTNIQQTSHPSHPSNLPLQIISNALSLGPTLLPPQLARLITALSLATKVSLRATALFVELIIESCRYSTSVGLGLSRRALISAVGSARTFYVVREGLDWAGGKAADSLTK